VGNLYKSEVTEKEIEQLNARYALQGAIMPDGSRPSPIPPEVGAVFRRHPAIELAQRERELDGIARQLQQ
jgi:hypothetical protein